MEKRAKREARGRHGRDAGQGVRQRDAGRAGTAKPGGERAEVARDGPRRSCHDCVFCVSNVVLWLRTLMSGFPVGGMCANHPDTPGQLREVPGRPCRNFRGKPLRVEPPQPPNDKIRYIPLTRGLHAIVDAEDYEWLSRYKWHAAIARGGLFYARRNSPNGVVSMHREIMKAPEGMVVDHINGNGLDNRRCNLRLCTAEQNALNTRPRTNTKSRFKGVFPHGNKWLARVRYKGRRFYLGLFDNEMEAAKARDRKAVELFGEYAWRNLPPDSPEGDAGNR